MDDEPVIRVVRGVPTAEELAALVGVLLSRPVPSPTARSAPEAASRWARSARSAGSVGSARPWIPGRTGPGAWRASALPA